MCKRKMLSVVFDNLYLVRILVHRRRPEESFSVFNKSSKTAEQCILLVTLSGPHMLQLLTGWGCFWSHTTLKYCLFLSPLNGIEPDRQSRPRCRVTRRQADFLQREPYPHPPHPSAHNHIQWREASANVLYECDWMIVCMLENMKNKQKEWHTATKP